MHTRVQLQLEPLLTGSLIPGPHSIVILSSSASFLAHRAEAAPLTGEKKINILLFSLVQCLIPLLIYCGIFKLCSHISWNSFLFHFPRRSWSATSRSTLDTSRGAFLQWMGGRDCPSWSWCCHIPIPVKCRKVFLFPLFAIPRFWVFQGRK